MPRSAKGVSRYAIKMHQVNRALKIGVESGRLIKSGDSFKVAKRRT